MPAKCPVTHSQQSSGRHMMSLVVKETRSATLQLMSKGTIGVVLQRCSSFWDGTAIHDMSDDRVKSIESFAKSMVSCVGLCYQLTCLSLLLQISFLLFRTSPLTRSESSCAYLTEC